MNTFAPVHTSDAADLSFVARSASPTTRETYRRTVREFQRAMAGARIKPIFEGEARGRHRGGQGGILIPADFSGSKVGRSPREGGAAIDVAPRSVESAVRGCAILCRVSHYTGASPMLLNGSLLQGRYYIERELGRGGMGAVYEAIDQRFGRRVAIKETLCDGDRLKRAFEHEARLLNSLRHRALPVVTDYFIEGDRQVLVMDFVSGRDLGQLLAERGRAFPWHEVIEWGSQLLSVLEYLHGHTPPIVHRDIKPQNLKLTVSGEVKLLDFGLAKGIATEMAAVPDGTR